MSNPSKPSASDDDSKDSRPTPWIKWSDYTSTDANIADLLEIKVVVTATFEARYGKAVQVLVKKGIEWVPYNLPLKANSSNNGKLEYLWDVNTQNGRIKPGAEFILKTWKRKSKTSEWMVRDFEMVFKMEVTVALTSSDPSPSRNTKRGDRRK